MGVLPDEGDSKARKRKKKSSGVKRSKKRSMWRIIPVWIPGATLLNLRILSVGCTASGGPPRTGLLLTHKQRRKVEIGSCSSISLIIEGISVTGGLLSYQHRHNA
jgi:hypothetical protein